MKNILNIISKAFGMVLVMLLAWSCKSNTPNAKASLFVRGNCDMCKERIEKTVRSLPGMVSAEWSVETSTLNVVYDSNQVKEIQIHEAVAKTGHGTKQVPMNQENHDKLPECCQVGGMHSMSSVSEKPSCCTDKIAQQSCCKEQKSCCTATVQPKKENFSCCEPNADGTAKDCCKEELACCH